MKLLTGRRGLNRGFETRRGVHSERPNGPAFARRVYLCIYNIYTHIHRYMNICIYIHLIIHIHIHLQAYAGIKSWKHVNNFDSPAMSASICQSASMRQSVCKPSPSLTFFFRVGQKQQAKTKSLPANANTRHTFTYSN